MPALILFMGVLTTHIYDSTIVQRKFYSFKVQLIAETLLYHMLTSSVPMLSQLQVVVFSWIAITDRYLLNHKEEIFYVRVLYEYISLVE